MTALPDLAAHGYRVVALLSAHPQGGRATYRAQSLQDGHEVVIKQFRFTGFDASWEGFAEQKREIEILRELDHPRIPNYIDSFTTDDGFCLVQELVNLPSLATRTSFTPAELKRIALSVLEILAYLQRRLPPVIHRDLKPANILISDKGSAYLVDFGLARAGGRSASTIAVGTPGFMAPEQLLGRPLTPRTDLYGLGATLIAMLTGTECAAMADLLDTSMRFDLRALPADLNPTFVVWLQRMVDPDPLRRFDNAEMAGEVLLGIEVRRAPALQPAPVPTRPPSPPGPARPSNRQIQLGGLVAAGFGIAALLFAGKFFSDFSRQKADRPERVIAEPPVVPPTTPKPRPESRPEPKPEPEPSSCAERDAASNLSIYTFEAAGEPYIAWTEELVGDRDCRRLAVFHRKTGALISEIELTEGRSSSSLEFRQAFEREDQTYLWIRYDISPHNHDHELELLRLPDLQRITATAPARLEAAHEQLRGRLQGFVGTSETLRVFEESIWLTDVEGHVWHIDSLTGEIESVTAMPGDDDPWPQRCGHGFASNGTWKFKSVDEQPAEGPGRWEGQHRVEVVECPRCRLRITPPRKAAVITDAAFLDPEGVSSSFQDRCDRTVGHHQWKYRPLPLLVEHATSLAKDAKRQLSLVTWDGSLAWTVPSSTYPSPIPWADDEVVMLRDYTAEPNMPMIRTVSIATGETLWKLGYPRAPGRGAEQP